MTTEPRIRPRTWPWHPSTHGVAIAPRRWWRPALMILRRVRARLPGASAFPAAAPPPACAGLTRLERHWHHRVHERWRPLTPAASGERSTPLHAPSLPAAPAPWVRVVALRVARPAPALERAARRAQASGSGGTGPGVTRAGPAVLQPPIIRQFRLEPGARLWNAAFSPPSVRAADAAWPIRRLVPAGTPIPVTALRSPRVRAVGLPRATGEPASATAHPVVAHRLGRTVAAAPAPVPSAGVRPAPSLEHPKIAWRKPAPRPPALEIAAAATTAGRVDRPAGIAVPADSGPSTQPARPAPAPMALPLEGPALDRLAEDVMYRIERRTRIERERRGL